MTRTLRTLTRFNRFADRWVLPGLLCFLGVIAVVFGGMVCGI